MYVMTMDQRGSTADVDRVPALLAELAQLCPGARFERSVGDEVQGVPARPDDVVEIALHVLRSGRWYVGIGVGPVDLPLPASPREGSGAAFVAARLAVERAKSAAPHVPLAVVVADRQRRPGAGAPAATTGSTPDGSQAGGPPGGRECSAAEAVLRLIGRLVQDRTAAQWKVVDALRGIRQGHAAAHGTQKIAARQLGITEQSVSRALLRSGWQEEWAARPAAEMLLDLAHGLAVGPDSAGPDNAGPDNAGSDNATRHTRNEGDR